MSDTPMKDTMNERGAALHNDTEVVDVESLQAKCDEYLAGWKRAQADYANLVKETDRSRQEFAKYATEQSLAALVPAIDQFTVAMQYVPSLETVPDADRKKFENWIIGIEAVRSLWETAAKDMGLERVRSTGALDPTIHEAVGEESHDEVTAGEIIRVVQNGWRLNGRLLRPAKVIISTGPTQSIIRH